MPGPRKDLALVRFALSKLDLKMNLTPTLLGGQESGGAGKRDRIDGQRGTEGDDGRDRESARARGYSLVGDLLDLAAHLEDVILGLDDVGPGHQEERIRGLQSS